MACSGGGNPTAPSGVASGGLARVSPGAQPVLPVQGEPNGANTALVCHRQPATGTFTLRYVNPAAVAGHVAHGDAEVGDAVPGMAMKVFGAACELLDDGDEDLVPDGADNCPATPNPDQSDTDNNGFGDVCEPSLIGDEIFCTWQRQTDLTPDGLTNNFFDPLTSPAAGDDTFLNPSQPNVIVGPGVECGLLFDDGLSISFDFYESAGMTFLDVSTNLLNTNPRRLLKNSGERQIL